MATFEIPSVTGTPQGTVKVILVGADAVQPFIPIDSAGDETGTDTNPLRVDPTGATTQPVSAVSLPLPAGAATEASLASVDSKTPALASGRVPVDGSGVTQPVSAVSLPLPSGAATEATAVASAVVLDSIDTNIDSIDAKLPALDTGRVPVIVASLPLPSGAATEATLSGMSAKLPAALVSGRLDVNIGASPATVPVSAASLPLPSGAATAAKQPTPGVSGTPSADVLTIQGAVGMTAVVTDGSAVTQPVSVSTLPLPSGAATEATLQSVDGKLPALASGRVPVDGSGVTQPISASTLPLPSGAATEASLSGISGKLPSALVGGRIDVNIGASPATVPVSAASLPLPSGAATEASLTSIDGKTPSLVSGRVPVDGSGVTQPVSGTVTADTELPAAAALADATANPTALEYRRLREIGPALLLGV